MSVKEETYDALSFIGDLCESSVAIASSIHFLHFYGDKLKEEEVKRCKGILVKELKALADSASEISQTFKTPS